ncbi:hypothetical protein CC78DRAFT_510601 [Lojkania enalia]|uniref:Zn(2)-C6 fungal-type domain-containing protein n=1 Tax=Lojkania enalia TaxID=147567 RepID=A0A9P4KFF4_9PLEO|nr:hypothetical protein CC78DRAFT_510601 [Didymosphaeria enalia]
MMTIITPKCARPSHLYFEVGYSLFLRTANGTNDTAASFEARKRRGHTKSRLGCISCKKRKIKCQETWPSCANCVKRGCACRYPTVFKHTQHDRIVSEVLSNPRPFVRLSDTPSMYSANDMRLFHHFLIAAHPRIPPEHEAVWIRDVPAFSHQYDYLMHALLALSDSHLSMFVNDPKANMALAHRQKAIRGLEQAFSKWPPTAEEIHAILATSYLLSFQSMFMPDGFIDCIVSLRSCSMLSQYILEHRLAGAFAVPQSLEYMGLELKLRNFPVLDQELVRDGLRSLDNIKQFVNTPSSRTIEKTIFAQLVESLRPLLFPPSRSESIFPSYPIIQASLNTGIDNASSGIYRPPFNHILKGKLKGSFEEVISQPIAEVPHSHIPDPVRSFQGLVSGTIILNTWPQDEVLELLSPSNKLGNILMAHFCAVRFIVAPLTAHEGGMKIPFKGMLEWCERFVDIVEDDEDVKWTQYVDWTARMLRTMRSCVNQRRGLTFGELYDILTNDPAAFREGRLMNL